MAATKSRDKILLKVDVQCRIQKDEVGYIAHCPSLDVFSQSGTEEKAIANLAEALQLFLESCRERGTLDAVLADCGFEEEVVSSSVERRTPARSRSKSHLDIQIPLMVQHAQ